MTKLRITNLKQVQTSIRKEIIKVLRDESIRDNVGKIVVDEIRDEKFPVTSQVTKKWREYLEKGNKTHEKYNRNYINLTFTGELLNDLRGNIKARFTKGKAEYIIEHSNKKHNKYKKPSGKPLKGTKQSYKKIGEYLFLLGYPYLIFSNKSEKKVLKYIKEAILKRLTR